LPKEKGKRLPHQTMRGGKDNFIISVGSSCTSPEWKALKIKWDSFVSKCTTTKRTEETITQWRLMPKDKKLQVKDVGGFTAAEFLGGKRSKKTLGYLSCVTLDADNADKDFPKRVKATVGSDYIWYTTHSHDPEKEIYRYRLIIPLDRRVTGDEYIPIALTLAEAIGLDYFDPTTFEPTRLMFWPSTSFDGVFKAHYHDGGKWVDADAVLKRYGKDWRDSSKWPKPKGKSYITPSESQIALKDPKTRDGVPGIFNQCFSVHDVLEIFLEPFYEPTDDPNRWTYKGGTTAGGLHIFPDGYCYSYHATDPAGTGHCCDAFDLVRVHLFNYGEQESVPYYESKSVQEALTWAKTQPKVQKRISKELLKKAKSAVRKVSTSPTRRQRGVVSSGARQALTDLLATLTSPSARKPRPSYIEKILEGDPNLAGMLAYDMMLGKIVVESPPWGSDWITKKSAIRPWQDSDTIALVSYLDSTYEISGAGVKPVVEDTVRRISERYCFHPIQEYFYNLPEWDGTARLEELFINVLGAADTAITRIMTRKFMVAAVARIFDPGVKFDSMIILAGPGGIGKSMLGRKLAGDYFCDSFSSFEGKDAMSLLVGKWIVEMPELDAMTKTKHLETVKAFLSRQGDYFRAAYGRYEKENWRSCVFWGTSNDKNVVPDDGGNRRFWIIPCSGSGGLRIESVNETYVNALWAEAYAYYNLGEQLYLTNEEAVLLQEVQTSNLEIDEHLVATVRRMMITRVPENWFQKTSAERTMFWESSWSSSSTPTEGFLLSGLSSNDVAEAMGRAPSSLKTWERRTYLSACVAAGMKRTPPAFYDKAIHPLWGTVTVVWQPWYNKMDKIKLVE